MIEYLNIFEINTFQSMISYDLIRWYLLFAFHVSVWLQSKGISYYELFNWEFESCGWIGHQMKYII